MVEIGLEYMLSRVIRAQRRAKREEIELKTAQFEYVG
jgi:hypothetical protein